MMKFRAAALLFLLNLVFVFAAPDDLEALRKEIRDKRDQAQREYNSLKTKERAISKKIGDHKKTIDFLTKEGAKLTSEGVTRAYALQMERFIHFLEVRGGRLTEQEKTALRKILVQMYDFWEKYEQAWRSKNADQINAQEDEYRDYLRGVYSYVKRSEQLKITGVVPELNRVGRNNQNSLHNTIADFKNKLSIAEEERAQLESQIAQKKAQLAGARTNLQRLENFIDQKIKESGGITEYLERAMKVGAERGRKGR